MKRLFYFFLFVYVAVTANAQARYVFYFIGDGMGVNQVNGTETYRAEIQKGRISVEPLLSTWFPVGTMATTFFATNSATDSSAVGTVLSTGGKAYNGAIGMDDQKNPLQTVAEKAKRAGKKVGVTTSVSVDHATPAAFYAHRPDHNMYYEIATDLPKAGFDFYAGAGFLKPTTTYNKKEAPSVFPMFEEAGYTIVRGYDDYKAKAAAAGKMILIQGEGADAGSLPYAIDSKEGDLTLTQITENAIDFLTKGKNKGFFLMVEGGKINWACHGNDAATVLHEAANTDNTIKAAYEFYKKHPKETLIVVTADHETGGMALGTGGYALNLKALESQKASVEELFKKISDLRKAKNNHVAWGDVKNLLPEQVGFWSVLPISWEQEKKLRDEYEKLFVKNKVEFAESMYAKTEPMAAKAKEVMDQIATVGWTSDGHSAGYVPVFVIGAGSDPFIGKMDNTEIPRRTTKAGGYK